MIATRRKRGESKGFLQASSCRWLKRAASAVISFVAGGVNALFGGGGGVLIVPTLENGLGEEEKRAHATSVAVTLPLSLFSALVLTFRGTWDATLALTIGVGATVGGALGAILLKRLPKGVLSLFFYALMIYAGIKYLV